MNNIYKVTFINFLISRLRQIPFFRLKKLVQESEKHNLGIGYDYLEVHFMAGGSPETLIKGLKYTKEAGIKAKPDDIAALEYALKAKGKISLLEWLDALNEEGFKDLKNAPFPE